MNSKQTEKIRKYNMEYLQLNRKQYKIYERLMQTVTKDWPQDMVNYITEKHGNEAACGDAISCWIAEWIKSKDMDKTLKMLHEIEEKKSIYNIHYCRSGVGFIFYEGPGEGDDNWNEHLTVDTYYPTFEEAVKGEWERMK